MEMDGYDDVFYTISCTCILVFTSRKYQFINDWYFVIFFSPIVM